LEFQAYYYALNYRKTFNDNSIWEVHIPILFFNFPQEVTAGSITQPGKDTLGLIQDISDSHRNEAIEISKQLKVFSALEAMGLEPSISSMHSIHRHPDSLSVFSSVDYGKGLTETGLVYPLAEGEANQSNYASILLMSNDRARLGRTEFRIFNRIDDTLAYEKGRLIAFTKSNCFYSDSERFFKLDNCYENLEIFQDEIKEPTLVDFPILKTIEDIWLSSDFIPSTKYVLPENVKKAQFKYFGYGQGNYFNYKAKPTNLVEYNNDSFKYEEPKTTDKFDKKNKTIKLLFTEYGLRVPEWSDLLEWKYQNYSKAIPNVSYLIRGVFATLFPQFLDYDTADKIRLIDTSKDYEILLTDFYDELKEISEINLRFFYFELIDREFGINLDKNGSIAKLITSEVYNQDLNWANESDRNSMDSHNWGSIDTQVRILKDAYIHLVKERDKDVDYNYDEYN
jgi:hypothetical protein